MVPIVSFPEDIVKNPQQRRFCVRHGCKTRLEPLQDVVLIEEGVQLYVSHLL